MSPDKKLLDNILIASGSILCIAFLVALHKGLSPAVFSDEWIYSNAARLQPLSESISPSYLYLFLFSGTNYCGDGFLECARILNAIFFSLGFPIIYLIAIKTMPRKKALYIFIISMLCPMSSYTAYFMPESLYFFSFWVFTWFIFTSIESNPLILGSGAGFILGIMSLIKMHAIFFIPAMIIFLGLVSFYRIIEIDRKKVFLTIVYMLMVFVLIREPIGYMIAGYKGLSITGEKYSYHIIAAFDTSRLLLIVKHIKTAVLGHLMAIMLLFSVPLAIIINALNGNDEQTKNFKLLICYSLSCIISLLFFTTFTTTEIAGWNPYESLNRIHMRYYSFIFPLFFIITINESSRLSSKRIHWKKTIFMTAFFGIIMYAILFIRKQYIISFIDCPELFGIIYNSIVFKGLSLLNITCLIFWVLRKNWGAALYIYLFLPLTLLASNYFVNAELRQERLYHTDAYDRAGRFVHDYLGSEASYLTVVAPEQAGLAKTLFYLDNPQVSKSELPINFPIEVAKIPKDKKWVLFIGHYFMLRKPCSIISMGDFTLIKIKK